LCRARHGYKPDAGERKFIKSVQGRLELNESVGRQRRGREGKTPAGLVGRESGLEQPLRIASCERRLHRGHVADLEHPDRIGGTGERQQRGVDDVLAPGQRKHVNLVRIYQLVARDVARAWEAGEEARGSEDGVIDPSARPESVVEGLPPGPTVKRGSVSI
jgi:hypothetical protein